MRRAWKILPNADFFHDDKLSTCFIGRDIVKYNLCLSLGEEVVSPPGQMSLDHKIATDCEIQRIHRKSNCKRREESRKDQAPIHVHKLEKFHRREMRSAQIWAGKCNLFPMRVAV